MQMTEERDSKFEDRTIEIIQCEQNQKQNKMNKALGSCEIVLKCLIFLSLEFLKEEKELHKAYLKKQ